MPTSGRSPNSCSTCPSTMNRESIPPTIAIVQDDRLLDEVVASTDVDRHIARHAGRDALPDRVTRRLQGGKRTSPGAGIGVVATVRHMEFQGP